MGIWVSNNRSKPTWSFNLLRHDFNVGNLVFPGKLFLKTHCLPRYVVFREMMSSRAHCLPGHIVPGAHCLPRHFISRGMNSLGHVVLGYVWVKLSPGQVVSGIYSVRAYCLGAYCLRGKFWGTLSPGTMGVDLVISFFKPHCW